MADLISIPMLTDEHAAALRRLDIKSTDTLLFGVNTLADLQALSASTRISADELRQFVAFSEILRLPGVGTSLGRNLYQSGLTSVRAIARMQPVELVQHMHLKRAVSLSGRKAEQIVNAARAMRQRFDDAPVASPAVFAAPVVTTGALPMLGDE